MFSSVRNIHQLLYDLPTTSEGKTWPALLKNKQNKTKSWEQNVTQGSQVHMDFQSVYSAASEK